LQFSFGKRVSQYKALLRKMTLEEKAFYVFATLYVWSSNLLLDLQLCRASECALLMIYIYIYIYTLIYIYIHIYIYMM